MYGSFIGSGIDICKSKFWVGLLINDDWRGHLIFGDD